MDAGEEEELAFYYAPRTRAGVVLWMLEELGVPYDMKVLNLRNGDHKGPDYLAVNPMGKVPAIVHNGTVVTETAAICCHLADAFPDAGLAPPIGAPLRGTYLRWMFFAPGCIEPAIADFALKREPGPQSMMAYGDFDGVMKVTADAVAAGDYLVGDSFSAADVVMGSMLRYGTRFKVLSRRPEFTAYIERLEQRPALQRATARDEEIAASLGQAVAL